MVVVAQVVVLLLLGTAAGAVVFVVMRGERTWLDEPAPDVELTEEAPTVTPAATAADEPAPEHPEVFVLEALPEPLAQIGAERVGRRSSRTPRRRPRFEDVADVTLPDPYLSEPGAQLVMVQAPPIPEKIPVHIPITTRLFGAVRLMLLVAVSAAAVALAVVGAGYLLIDRVLSGL